MAAVQAKSISCPNCGGPVRTARVRPHAERGLPAVPDRAGRVHARGPDPADVSGQGAHSAEHSARDTRQARREAVRSDRIPDTPGSSGEETLFTGTSTCSSILTKVSAISPSTTATGTSSTLKARSRSGPVARGKSPSAIGGTDLSGFRLHDGQHRLCSRRISLASAGGRFGGLPGFRLAAFHAVVGIHRAAKLPGPSAST